MLVFARQRADGAHAAAHEPFDVVREIREAILAARRAEVGDVDVEARRGDVAGERAAGQQIHDEVAADGRRHEQHGRPACARLARLVEQAQQPQLVLAVDDAGGRSAGAVMARRRQHLVQALELGCGRGATIRAGPRARAPDRAPARAPPWFTAGPWRSRQGPSSRPLSSRRLARRASGADLEPGPRAGAARTGSGRAYRRSGSRARGRRRRWSRIRFAREQRAAHRVAQMDEEILVLDHRIHVGQERSLPLLLLGEPALDQRRVVVGLVVSHAVPKFRALQKIPSASIRSVWY